MTSDPTPIADPYAPPVANLQGPPATAPTVGVAFRVRLGARLIDLVLHYLCGFAAGLLLVLGIMLMSPNSPESLAAQVGAGGTTSFLCSLLGMILSVALCEGLAGATFGKRLLGLVVIREDGTRCTMVPALKRSAAFLWDSLFFGIIAYQKMEQSPLEQRHGDHWAKTLVVRRKWLRPEQLPGGGRLLLAVLLGLCLDVLLQGAGYLVDLFV